MQPIIVFSALTNIQHQENVTRLMNESKAAIFLTIGVRQDMTFYTISELQKKDLKQYLELYIEKNLKTDPIDEVRKSVYKSIDIK